jgi:16S rRNA (guanine966-N2)-methyltransferase
MTRIIAGSARGRRLRTPVGDHTRPTTDRVREALFSALEASLGSLQGLRFLDLYAGSGAVGLEAMSRGAGVATLVESDRRTAKLVRANADALDFRRAEVVDLAVARAVAQPPRAPYDVVFLDPPYATASADVEEVLRQLVEQGWLAHGAVVVVERSARDPEPTWPRGIVADRSKSYGDTALWWATADSTRR